jgi:hypothetical protein
MLKTQRAAFDRRTRHQLIAVAAKAFRIIGTASSFDRVSLPRELV